jgi:amino acid transporter
MTTYPVHLEETTQLALHEKSKLIKSLRRFDMVFFTVCAFVGLDTLGTVASNGPQGFVWLVLLAFLFVAPYALLMAEAGSTFCEEGGPYEWMKLAWGRLAGGIGAVLYWVTNPLWVGGSLAFISTDAWRTDVSSIGHGTAGDYFFKFFFIWISIGVAIVSLRYGKWIPNVGAFLRFATLGFFSITVVVYGIEHGFNGAGLHGASPSRAVFIALVPVLLFNYVGFELQNGAAEEMENPQRDVPVSVFQSGVLGVFSYVIPILGILLVLPLAKVTGIGGFIDAVKEVFGVYGGAAHTLLVLMTIGFIGSLITSGAVWMIGSDRVQAVAAYDGAFFPFFGIFNRKLGTPVRVNVLSGIVSTVFCFSAVAFFNSGANSTFTVVLDIAISTTLLSYVLIFPAILKLRYTHGDVKRGYTFPLGKGGIWTGTVIATFFVVLGSWVAVFPNTIEKVIGVDTGSFHSLWGVSRVKFETYTLGTLAVIVGIAVIGYVAGAPTRRQSATEPIELNPGGEGATYVAT